MKKTNLLLLSSILALSLAGCSSTPTKTASAEKAADCVFPNSDKAAPGWICDGPVEGVKVGAMGAAIKTEAGFDFMRQMAAASARVQLAQNLHSQVQNMIKKYAEVTGVGKSETVDRVNTLVTKEITNETLQGTKIVKSITGPDGTLYVYVGMDDAVVREMTESAIKSSMHNDRAAWQKFQAKLGQDELAAAIAKQQLDKEKTKADQQAEEKPQVEKPKG